MNKLFFYCVSLLLVATSRMCAIAPNTVIATINTGITPAGLAITPDNKFAYVANNNNYSFPGGDTVSVINLSNNLVLQTIVLDASPTDSLLQPYTVTINAAGTKAYVTNSNSTTVSVIDIATNTVSGTINGFDGPSGLVIVPGTSKAYVNNYGGPEGVGSGNGNTVSIVNLNSNTIVGTITLALVPPAAAPSAMAITPDGAFVYVTNYVDGNTGTGTMSIIRTSDNTVVGTIPGFSGPFAIAITPNGKYAYVTNFGSNNFIPIGTTVSVVDLSANTIVATINLGIQPSGIAITPDGRYAYVSNYNTLYAGSGFTDLTAGQGTVNIIDLATNTVIPPTITVDQSPDAIVISANGEFAYVSNFTSNTVNVIALQSFVITAQGCKSQNIFLTQTDLINRLTWNAVGTSMPVSYSIYRDAELTDLAATILASDNLIFLDHNRNPNLMYTYYIVGTNNGGTRSLPVAISVTNNC